MDPVIGQLPSNSIFMDKTIVQDRIFSDNLSIFLFSLYIYIYLSSSLFPLLHPFLVSISSSIRPCFHGGGWFVAADTEPMDPPLVFPLFSNPLSPFLPTVVKSRYLLSGIEWILVARSKNKCLARARGHRRVKPGFARDARNLLIPTFHVLVVCCCSIAGRDSRASIFNGRNNWISNKGSNGNVNFCKWKLFEHLTFVSLFYFSASSSISYINIFFNLTFNL